MNSKQKQKNKIIENINDKLTILNQKQVDYLTKRFVFNRTKREQKRSIFITKKIKVQQKKLLLGLNYDNRKDRMKTKYGGLYERTLKLPSMLLFLVFEDMQQDIVELNAESQDEIIKRLNDNGNLDEDGTIVTAFVQKERQNIVDDLKKIFYQAPKIEIFDNPKYLKQKRFICRKIIEFVTITQATVDLGNFSPDLHYTWGVWFNQSDFTDNNYKKTVGSLINRIKRTGLPATSNMLGLSYTRDFQNTRRIVKFQKEKKKGGKQ